MALPLLRASVFLAAVSLVSFPLVGQSPENDVPPIRVSVNLVQVEARVTDSKGVQITDLRPQDFEVLVDGVPQRLTSATYRRTGMPVDLKHLPNVKVRAPKSSESLPPGLAKDMSYSDWKRTIVFLVDDFSLTPQNIPAVRKAINTIVSTELQPGDLAAVVRSSGGYGALEQLTSNRDVLRAAAERIRWIPQGHHRPDIYSAAANPEDLDTYEKVARSLESTLYRLRSLPGQKAIVFISQAWTSGSKLEYSDKTARLNFPTYTGILVDHALRAGVNIYTVDPTPLDSMQPGADYDITQSAGGGDPNRLTAAIAAAAPGTYANGGLSQLMLNRIDMEELARGTGGFMIADSNDISFGAARVLDDLQGFYQLEFKPDDHFLQNPFHKLQVRVKQKGLHVRSYAGFTGQAEERYQNAPKVMHLRYEAKEGTDSSLDGGGRLLRALNSPFAASDIHLQLTALFSQSPTKSPQIAILLHIDAHDILLTEGSDGRRHGLLDLITRATDEKGASEELKNTVSIQIQDSNFEKVNSLGLLFQTSMNVPKPGTYEIQVAVQDTNGQKVGSAHQYVSVPDLKKESPAVSGILAYGAGSGIKVPAPNSLYDSWVTNIATAETTSVAARRLFTSTETLHYTFQVFGANPTELRVRLFKEGKLVPDQDITVSRTDSGGTGEISLTPLNPGNYELQVIAEEAATKKTASQWTDFEIVR